MVIGPTPPGTGVIAPARSAAGSNSTSPCSFPSTRFIPTSITVAPGLIQAPLTKRTTGISWSRAKRSIA